MFKLLEHWANPDLMEDTQNLEPVFYDPTSFEEFEAQFHTPLDSKVSIPKRVVAGVGVTAIMIAGAIGYEAGQPDTELNVSPDQIAEDLNSGDHTTKPVIIEQNSELIIPKENSDDTEVSIVNPIRLGDKTYGAFVFDDEGNAKVVEVKSNVPLKTVETDEDDSPESTQIMYPISLVYTEVPTKGGKTERVYSAVAGDESGNAANTVKINETNATPDQKKLLKDKTLKKLVKDTVSLTAQDRVGYLDISN